MALERQAHHLLQLAAGGMQPQSGLSTPDPITNGGSVGLLSSAEALALAGLVLNLAHVVSWGFSGPADLDEVVGCSRSV